jgi:hypothetical protein
MRSKSYKKLSIHFDKFRTGASLLLGHKVGHSTVRRGHIDDTIWILFVDTHYDNVSPHVESAVVGQELVALEKAPELGDDQPVGSVEHDLYTDVVHIRLGAVTTHDALDARVTVAIGAGDDMDGHIATTTDSWVKASAEKETAL